MKLQQLRYLLEIQRHHFNISKAAKVLCTSQSGISKQIQLLENELNLQLFQRRGKHLIAFSEAGVQVLRLAEQVVGKADDIRSLSEELNQRHQALAIAATHTQARYMLPAVVERFMQQNPKIKLHIHQGTPTQIAAMLEHNDVDIAIATESLADRDSLLALPYYQWGRSIITQIDHPLVARQTRITLHDIIQYPIITYVRGFTGRHKVDETFARHQLQPDIVLAAVDADVIKTYVRLGLGIGIIADMAFNHKVDKDLHVFDARHLFGISTSLIAIKKDKYLKNYVLRFIETLAPHLSVAVVRQALTCNDTHKISQLVATFDVPVYPQPMNQH